MNGALRKVPGNREHVNNSASSSGTTQEAPLAGAAGIPTSDTPDRCGILLATNAGVAKPFADSACSSFAGEFV
jgi:hypothetical protein